MRLRAASAYAGKHADDSRFNYFDQRGHDSFVSAYGPAVFVCYCNSRIRICISRSTGAKTPPYCGTLAAASGSSIGVSHGGSRLRRGRRLGHHTTCDINRGTSSAIKSCADGNRCGLLHNHRDRNIRLDGAYGSGQLESTISWLCGHPVSFSVLPFGPACVHKTRSVTVGRLFMIGGLRAADQ
jgi:hypothetical protein